MNATSITEDEIVKEAAISRRCSSLIRRSATGNRFELAHFTVKEYLQAIDPESPLAIFRYNEYEAAQPFTRTNLRYLMFTQFGRQPRLDDAFLRGLADRNHTYQFYPYAAVQWTKANLVQGDAEILRLSRLLFQADTPCYLNWAIQFLCDVIGVTPGVSDECRDLTKRAVEYKLPRFHMGAALGRAGICEAILDQDTADPGRSPLDCALGGPKAVLNKFSDPINRNVDPSFLARTLDVLLSRMDKDCGPKRTPLTSPNCRSYSMWALAVCRALGSADPFKPFLHHQFGLDESIITRLRETISDTIGGPRIPSFTLPAHP